MGKGSSRFSAATRQTGGDSDGISHKPSKKLKKLSFVGEMDQSSQSTSTTTSSKRVKHPKKFFDEYDTVNHASVPRKLRSAMKKRHYESVSPSSRNGICRFDMASNDRNAKLKVGADARRSTMSESIAEKLTKDEEEAMAALLAMAGIVPAGNDNTNEINLNNDTSEAEASTLQDYDSKTTCEASKSKDLVRKSGQIEDLNETSTVDVEKDLKDVSDGNKSRMRCASHVYICRLIKDLQVRDGKLTNSHKEPKQGAYVDANTDTTPENITNGYADRMSNGMIFEDQWHACGVEARSRTVLQNHTSVPVRHQSAAASGQVPVVPYFGSPLYDPSQWSRPLFPKQQMWMNPFIPGGRYQNWQNGRCETMPPYSSSYVGLSGSKLAQTSFLDVTKMPFGHGYDENGDLFRVDSSPTLNLTLQ